MATLSVHMPRYSIGEAIIDVNFFTLTAITVATIVPAIMPVATVHAMVAPIAIVGEPSSHKQRGSEIKQWLCRRALIVHDLGVVARLIHILWLSGHNADVVIIFYDALLRRINEIAHVPGLSAKLLHSVHHIHRLRGKGIADLGGPFQIFIHPGKRVGITSERAHAWVPWPVLGLLRVPAALHEASCQHDIRRNGGRWQDQRDEGIWIERDGPEKLSQFFGRMAGNARFIGVLSPE